MKRPASKDRTEEDVPTAQSVSSFDLDAILSMFPTKNAAPNAESNGGNSDERSGFELDLLEDPLYGLMDCPMMPFSDISDFLLDRPVAL